MSVVFKEPITFSESACQDLSESAVKAKTNNVNLLRMWCDKNRILILQHLITSCDRISTTVSAHDSVPRQSHSINICS